MDIFDKISRAYKHVYILYPLIAFPSTIVFFLHTTSHFIVYTFLNKSNASKRIDRIKTKSFSIIFYSIPLQKVTSVFCSSPQRYKVNALNNCTNLFLAKCIHRNKKTLLESLDAFNKIWRASNIIFIFFHLAMILWVID